MRSDRDAAGGDDDIRLESPGEGLLERSLRVLRGREPLDNGACLLEHARQHDPVRLVDLAGLERLSGRPQLGAGDQDRDARCAVRGDRLDPAGGDRTDAGGGEDVPRREHLVARPHVAAATGGCCRPKPTAAEISISSGRTTTRSTGITASAPSGTTAPVEISIASPAPRLR